jgi:alpha-1,6-mannosyltransferase
MDYERDPAKLAGIIASCDAFLHGNENEPFGLVALEALAAGIPVVGPSRGGIAELIDEEVGVNAVAADGAGLAEAVDALFQRDLEAVKLAARARAEARHGWNTTFESLTRIYGELVAGRPAAAPVALRA